jgi:hypothetical protein
MLTGIRATAQLALPQQTCTPALCPALLLARCLLQPFRTVGQWWCHRGSSPAALACMEGLLCCR